MKVFAISDLHLSAAVEKPMDVFGDGWQNHFDRVRESWLSQVTDEDLVLLGGDISWGLTLEEAAPDYHSVARLPGKKAVVKGNHDYYWTSLCKMSTAFPCFTFIQNNCARFENVIVAGSRGWTIPSDDTPESDLKIFRRELGRLELSLSSAEKIRTPDDIVVALLHFPPFDAKYGDSEVTEILKKHSVDKVLYGHLHGKNARVTPVVTKDGTDYILTSCDLVDNKLVRVL